MPFSSRVVQKRVDINEIYGPNIAQNVLEKSSVSNMIGLLSQLNEISKYAADIFGSLLQDAERSNERIQMCKKRLNSVEQRIQPIENMFIINAPSYFYDNPYTGREYSRRDILRGGFFTRNHSTNEINRRRNEAQPLANLTIFDKFSDNPNKPCIKKYSDPDFFIEQWLEVQSKKMEEEKKKRKLRREEKKAAKSRKVDRQETVAIKKVFKPDYLGGNKNNNASDTVNVTVYNIPELNNNNRLNNLAVDNVDEYGKSVSPDPTLGQQQQQQPPPPRQSPNSPNILSINNTILNSSISVVPLQQPSTPSIQQLQHQQQQQSSQAQLPPIPSSILPPVNPMQQLQQEPGGNEYGNRPPPPAPIMMNLNNIPDQSQQNYDIQPIQPPRPKPNLPTRQLGLLDQIKSGKQLKKAEPVQKEKPNDSRSLLLGQISGGAKSLRRVEVKEKKEEQNDNAGGGGIYAILQRRAMIAGDSSEEEEESDWGSDED